MKLILEKLSWKDMILENFPQNTDEYKIGSVKLV